MDWKESGTLSIPVFYGFLQCLPYSSKKDFSILRKNDMISYQIIFDSPDMTASGSLLSFRLRWRLVISEKM